MFCYSNKYQIDSLKLFDFCASGDAVICNQKSKNDVIVALTNKRIKDSMINENPIYSTKLKKKIGNLFIDKEKAYQSIVKNQVHSQLLSYRNHDF